MKESSEFRRVFLPYCLIPVSDGRYLVVNREYQALGEVAHMDYETHPSARRMKLTAANIAKISYTGTGSPGERVYLYNDGCVPTASREHWSAYAKRLAVLAKVDVDVSDG